MLLTVGEVVALPVMQRGAPEVLSACRWDAPIRWVHVSDADLSALLQGGELVLTTGAALQRDPRRYLRGLAAEGALGVVVELGTVVTDVPAGTAAIAEDCDLALIVLHRRVRFVEVTEAVHRLIVADQYDRVDFDRRVHETFTELTMKRPTAAGIVDAAAQILDEPVVLEDLAHQVLAVSPSSRAADLLHDWERRSRLSPGTEQWAVTAVGPRAEQWGRLIVPHRPEDPARTQMVLERAAVALALHRMIERDRSGLHHQAQSGLIDDVLRGRFDDERQAAARAHALGLRTAPRYQPAVVRVDRRGAAADPVAAQRRNVILLDAVTHTVNAAGHTGLFSIQRDGEIGMVLALRASRGAEKALAVLGENLRRETTRVDGALRSVLALGVDVDRIVDAIGGLAEAAHVAEVALSMTPSGGDRLYYRASDVRLRGLLSLLGDDPRVQSFAETELKTLLADDPAHLTVLREYLRLGGNKTALSQQLHISRPALYKRLATIGDILGVDLSDGESMTSLHVAVLILDARQRVTTAIGR